MNHEPFEVRSARCIVVSTEGPDFWSEVQEVFAEAMEIDPSERASLVSERCANRPELREEVESLLAFHDFDDSFLSVPAVDPGWRVGDDLAGTTVGPFRLVERIGAGGMGIVYLADRTQGEFAQRVAVKLLDEPVRNAGALRRFRAERQILATLSHPNIVTLLDGGVTEDGQPYLAMEYVEGAAITTYCRERALSIENRLRLFQQVCAAVQYAHQHGVVHSDLKPGNILISSDGIPKILDFGVARLIDASGKPGDATATGMPRPLTPNYASPEQLRGLPVTTVSDIYALGVLLYEVLTGVRPYDTAGKTVDEVLRIVVEEEPPRPSARVGTPLPYDARRLRGDLDAIVLKAISKDPARRFASARELAEDVTRHLSGRPVVAREPSFGYVVAKLARRHRMAFLSAAVALAALVSGLGVSLWQMRVAVTERNRAIARFNDVRQLAHALIFEIHDGVAPLPGSTPVRQQIVSEALKFLERLSRDPASDDDLRLELAKGYHRIGDVQGHAGAANLGDSAGALASYRKGAEILRPLVSGREPVREAALELGALDLAAAALASQSAAQGEALQAAREARALAESLLRRDSTDEDATWLLGNAHFHLAMTQGPAESLPDWQRAAEIYGLLLAQQPDDPKRQRNVALVQKYLGSYYEQRQDYAQAVVHHGKAQKLDERRLAADPTNRQAQLDVAIDLSNVAYAQWQTGRLVEAAAGYERSLEMRGRLAETDPKDAYARGRVAYAHSRLGAVYSELGRHTEALRHAEDAVRIGASQATFNATYTHTFADYVRLLGEAQLRAERVAAACASFRRSQALLVSLSTKETSDSSDLAARIRNQTQLLAGNLAACGTGAERAADPQKP
jgi:non-specific serine/threonine protein kinase/serine/threonine-protein kinase